MRRLRSAATCRDLSMDHLLRGTPGWTDALFSRLHGALVIHYTTLLLFSCSPLSRHCCLTTWLTIFSHLCRSGHDSACIRLCIQCRLCAHSADASLCFPHYDWWWSVCLYTSDVISACSVFLLRPESRPHRSSDVLAFWVLASSAKWSELRPNLTDSFWGLP